MTGRGRAARLGARVLPPAALLALLAGLLWGLKSSPALPFLWPVPGAAWLRCPRPISLKGWRGGDAAYCAFRKRLSVAPAPREAVLSVSALRGAAVFVDGRMALSPSRDPGASDWKRPRRVDLAPWLSPGEHELLIVVENRDGPAVLAARSDDLGLGTGPDWEAGGGPARLAADWDPPPVVAEFPTAAQAFFSALPLHLGVFALVFLLAGGLPGVPGRAPLEPSALRWALLGAWVLLGANDAAKLPADVGFDVSGHLDYIRAVAAGRLPLAPEGWQMFQSPLYYLLSAPFYLLFSGLTEAGAAAALRFIPLACGAAQVEVCWRALRAAFPGRRDLQTAGLLVGGLLPMNLYRCQTLGNEPLAGLLSALALAYALSLAEAEAPVPRGAAARLGALLGLALLAKATALLLAPLLLWAVLRKARAGGRPAAAWAAAALLGTAFAVAGWYYLRNWVLLGRPFVGGWDAGRGIAWWQDPGYRVFGDFLSFGRSLTAPVYACLAGFWDSLYSTLWLDGTLSGATTRASAPPWNHALMVSGAWLGLLPTGGLLWGALRGLRSGAPAALRFSAAAALVYLAALLGLYAKVPIYSTAKASYLSGLTPCLAVLAAAGLEPLLRRPRARAALWGGLAAWGVSAALAYWVV